MPRFDYHSTIDHRLDNQIVDKKDLRFTEQSTAEEFAVAQYLTDFIPRIVLRGPNSGLFMVFEAPERTEENIRTVKVPYIISSLEVFLINSVPGEG